MTKLCKCGKDRYANLSKCRACYLSREKEKKEAKKLKVKIKKETSYHTFEKKADDLWRLRINEIWKRQCAICGRSDKQLNAHHYIGRRNKATRWYLENGILLCCEHHKFGVMSAHENPEWFREKMLELLGGVWLKKLILQSNKIWDKNRYKVIEHLNYIEDNY